MNFHRVAKNFFGKKIEYSFLVCKFEKEASRKEKIAKVLEPQNFLKTKKKKNIGWDITDQRHISFLSLDNENCWNPISTDGGL